MSKAICLMCNGEIKPGQPTVTLSANTYHSLCNAELMADLEESTSDYEAEETRIWNKTQALFKRLKKSLKPKVWNCVQMLIDDYRYGYAEIVGIDGVKGKKNNAHDWYGESVAMRHVYDDTTTDYWGDGFNGYVYLPIGLDRYLKIYVWG